MSTAPLEAGCALLLFAHGARDPRWAAPFEAVAERVRAARPGVPVRLAFLEFMAPTLVEAGAALAADGCRAIAVVPMFLGAGGHVRRDLPLLLQALRDAHPGLAVTLAPAIGEQPDVADAMALAAARALDGEAASDIGHTVCIGGADEAPSPAAVPR